MKKKLTDRYLKSLAAPEHGRLEISDTTRPGLRFRLSSSGRAVWMFEKRVKGGKKRKHTIGGWPDPVSLSQARATALEIEAEAARGFDRVAAEQERRVNEALEQARAKTVADVIAQYDAIHLSDLRTRDERKRQLKQSLVGLLNAPIASLTRADLQVAIDAKARAGRKQYANRIRAALMHFSRWSFERGFIDEDFGARLPKASKEKARERVIALGEVRQIWAASFNLSAPWGSIVRLMLLTAQRRGEILSLRHDEVDLRAKRITKPGSRTKNSKPHITHLSQPAIDELTAIFAELGATKQDEVSEFVFTTTGRTPVSGIGKAKARLDDALGDDFEAWRLHDIRTAFATAMAEAGIPEAVADRILNHSASGSAPSAVARVYNQAAQLDQRAVALERWADMVTDKGGEGGVPSPLMMGDDYSANRERLEGVTRPGFTGEGLVQ